MKMIPLILCMLLLETASGQNTNVYDFAPSAIVTTTGTQWIGGATSRTFNSNTELHAGQYILLELNAAVAIKTITFGTFWSSDPRFIPAGYTIDYSNDGSSFTNAITVTGNTNVNPSHTLSPLSAKYWKLTATAFQTGQTYCSIANLQLLSNGVGSATNNSYWNIGGFNSNAISFNAGEVGIGTTAPQRKLHIAGNGTGFGQWLENTGTGVSETARFSFKTASGGVDARAGVIEWYDGNTFKGDFRLLRAGGVEVRNSNDNPIFSILNDGNVGIGTTTPQGRLAVNGTIFSKKITVTQTGWPDYVFSPSYELPSLQQVAAFIKTNRHLPDIPSAAEIEKEGLNLGDNQAALLKKIEELTLYAIEQEQKLTKQQQQINRLEEQLQRLLRRK